MWTGPIVWKWNWELIYVSINENLSPPWTQYGLNVRIIVFNLKLKNCLWKKKIIHIVLSQRSFGVRFFFLFFFANFLFTLASFVTKYHSFCGNGTLCFTGNFLWSSFFLWCSKTCLISYFTIDSLPQKSFGRVLLAIWWTAALCTGFSI